MSSPLANGSAGPDTRDARGRFGPGNKAACGRGNPHAAQVYAWRRALVEAVSEDDLRAVIGKLVEQAREGERWAVCELLDRCLGKPAQQSDPPAEIEPEKNVALKITFDEPRGLLASAGPPSQQS